MSAPASAGAAGEAPAGASALPAGALTHAVVSMVRLRPASVPWALWRLVRGPGVWRTVPGLRLAQVLGSGRDGGFGLRPGWDCLGTVAFFGDAGAASRFLATDRWLRADRDRSLEGFSALLAVSASRGRWRGHALTPAAVTAGPGTPVAVLTRAAIRPSRMVRFWRQSPAAEAALATAPGCRLAVGIGEAPLLRQATFSVWEDAAAMEAYARHGAHRRAADVAWTHGCFSEWLFARFVPLAWEGRWRGQALPPLTAATEEDLAGAATARAGPPVAQGAATVAARRGRPPAGEAGSPASRTATAVAFVGSPPAPASHPRCMPSPPRAGAEERADVR